MFACNSYASGGLQPELVPGEIILTDGAFNDTAVAKLYGYDYELIRSSKDLTNKIEEMITSAEIPYKRGLHWYEKIIAMVIFRGFRGFFSLTRWIMG